MARKSPLKQDQTRQIKLRNEARQMRPWQILVSNAISARKKSAPPCERSPIEKARPAAKSSEWRKVRTNRRELAGLKLTRSQNLVVPRLTFSRPKVPRTQRLLISLFSEHSKPPLQGEVSDHLGRFKYPFLIMFL